MWLPKLPFAGDFNRIITIQIVLSAPLIFPLENFFEQGTLLDMLNLFVTYLYEIIIIYFFLSLYIERNHPGYDEIWKKIKSGPADGFQIVI